MRPWIAPRLPAALALASILGGCTGVGPHPELAWSKATVFLPSDTTGIMDDPKVQTELAALRNQPVIVYLHGCNGIGASTRFDGAHYAKAGYVVVAPDSMAQPGRLANCVSGGGATPGFGYFPQRQLYRRAEIDYAWSQVSAAPWADRHRIYLAGHSEGGAAVAMYPAKPGQWRALFLSGWDCMGNQDVPAGIAADLAVPVLAINSKRDPEYGERGGECVVTGHPNSWSYRYEERKHWLGKDPEWQANVARFLQINGGL